MEEGVQPGKAIGGWWPCGRLLSNPLSLVPGWGLVGRSLGRRLVDGLHGSGWHHLLFYIGCKPKNGITNMNLRKQDVKPSFQLFICTYIHNK